MELQQLNDQLKLVAASTTEDAREHIFGFADMLVQWLGLEMQPNWPVMQEPINVKQRNFLVLTPKGMQPQKYRYTERTDPVYVRFAVVKNLRKHTLNDFVQRDSNFQDRAVQLPPDKRHLALMIYKANAYHLHLFTTAQYDRLVVVVSQGDQKRVVTFKERLSHTQFNRVLPAWKGVARKSKLEVMDQLWASLDIREVNKEFYQKVKGRFDDLVGLLEQQYPKATDTQRKQFAVRIIGRYIFCWFLKEKGIIPNALISLEAIDAHPDTYFQVYLRHLFLNTLNEEVQMRETISTGSPLDALYANIPYLNGGLFEEHNEDRLFAKADINLWLRGLVEVLENYDFTVDESSSTYQHVAIDPEMLGRIFENLLASQNPETEKLAANNQRKAFGAFYTPREIVEYMVNSALRSHLELKLLPPPPPQVPPARQTNAVNEPAVAYGVRPKKNTEIQGALAFADEPATAVQWTPADQDNYDQRHKRVMELLDRFFETDRSDNPFSKEDTVRVREALAEVTVLDPACGSGAFPMSMLLRLMELREIVGHGHSSRYALKDEILSRNIYGVDIMPMAVEIARLRAWLSLVLESDFRPKDRQHNFGIKALPNLDFKFVCANTLVDSGYDGFLGKVEQSLNPTLMRLDGAIQKLERLRDSYYDPKGDKHRKQELKAEFYATKDHIKNDFKGLAKSWGLHDFLSKVDGWDPFDDSRPAPFFSSGWMFGMREGFDVVIGNPPYVTKSFTSEQKKYFKANYVTAQYQIDLYVLFIEKAIHLLNPTGVMTYITPNSWLKNMMFSECRKFLLEQVEIKSILPYLSNIFEAVSVDTSVVLCQKALAPSGKEVFVNRLENGIVNVSHTVCQDEFWNNERYVFDVAVTPELRLVIRKIQTQSEHHGKFCEITRGVNPYDRARGQSPEIIETRAYHSEHKVDETFVPELKGKHLRLLGYNWDGKTYIKYGPWLAAPREPKYFIGPRLLMRQMLAERFVCSYTEEHIIIDQSIFISVVKEEYAEEISAKCIVGQFSSKLLINYFRLISNEYDILFPKIKIGEFRELPVCSNSSRFDVEISQIVDSLNGLEPNDTRFSHLMNQLDVVVYRMYNLTHSEVLVIDPEFGLSEEEYNSFNAV